LETQNEMFDERKKPRVDSEISRGALREILNNQRIPSPVFQVVQVDTAPARDRVRLALTDGDLPSVQALIFTASVGGDPHIYSGRLIRLDEYALQYVEAQKVINISKFTPISGPIPLSNHTRQGQQLFSSKPAAAPSFGPGSPPRQSQYDRFKKPTSPTTSADPFSRIPGAPPPVPGAPGHQAMQDPSRFQPISSLNNFSTGWRIKVRCVNKGEPREYTTKKGPNAGQQSRVANIDLLDQWGGEIRAVMFGETCDRFLPVFEQGKTYFISRGEVRPTNSQFYSKNNYELRLSPQSEVTECVDTAAAILHMKFNFIESIAKLEEIPVNTTIDMIAVVREIGPPGSIVTKVKKESLNKRNVVFVDHSMKQVEVTFWREFADRIAFQVGDAVALKGLRVGDFQGRSLSTGQGTYIEANPDHVPQTRQLLDWFAMVPPASVFERVGAGLPSSGGFQSRPAERRTIQQMKELGLGLDPANPEASLVQGVLSFIKRENLAYAACTTCNKKVFDNQGSFSCEKCQKTLDASGVTHRYIVSATLADHTGSCWVSCFNEAGEAIFHTSASEMVALKDTNEAGYNTKFQEALFKPQYFRVRPKMDEQGDDRRVRYTLHALPPFSFTEDGYAKLKEIKEYLQLEGKQ